MSATPPKKKKKIRIRTKLFVPLVFIVAILFITYIFPRQGSFNYSFDEGRPWQYGLLTAPFDFPVYKPAEQLKREQDSILVYFELYYLIDNQIMENAISRFDTDVNTKPNLKNLEPAYIRYIRNKLKEVYTQGIMS